MTQHTISCLLGDALCDLDVIETTLRKLPFAPYLASTSTRYILAAMIDERDDRTPGEQQSAELWPLLLGSIVKPTPLEWNEPLFHHLRESIPALGSASPGHRQRALWTRESCDLPLARIDAIGLDMARALDEQRIRTAEQFLYAAARSDDRAAIVANKGPHVEPTAHIEPAALLAALRLAELVVSYEVLLTSGRPRTPPIDGYCAVSLLAHAGVLDLKALADSEAASLATKLHLANESLMVVQPFDLDRALRVTVRAWIEIARNWKRHWKTSGYPTIEDDPKPSEEKKDEPATKAGASDC
jgi:hypothetical protein